MVTSGSYWDLLFDTIFRCVFEWGVPPNDPHGNLNDEKPAEVWGMRYPILRQTHLGYHQKMFFFGGGSYIYMKWSIIIYKLFKDIYYIQFNYICKYHQQNDDLCTDGNAIEMVVSAAIARESNAKRSGRAASYACVDMFYHTHMRRTLWHVASLSGGLSFWQLHLCKCLNKFSQS